MLGKILFDEKKIQNSKKNMFARPPARPVADRAGRRLGRLYFISFSINKVRMLKGVCQSSFALRNNPKLTKNHIRWPVLRRFSGCAPAIVALGCVDVPTNSVHMVQVINGACQRTLAMTNEPIITRKHVRH
jgi:hypothetical protein